jgi:hypothetical protein
LTAAPFAANHFSEDYAALEVCYCSFRLGDESAVSHYLARRNEDFASLDIDDQVIAHWMLAEMSRVDKRFGDTAKHLDLMMRCHEVYRANQAQLAGQLNQLPRLADQKA